LYFALARFVISNSKISSMDSRKLSDYEARPPLPVSRPTGRLANAHDASQPSAGKQTAEGWNSPPRMTGALQPSRPEVKREPR
jgi:hypothetical protein